MRFLKSYRGLFCISVIALFASFMDHRLSTLSLEEFLEGEFVSERYVLARMIYDLEHNPGAHGGFVLIYPGLMDVRDYRTRENMRPVLNDIRQEIQQEAAEKDFKSRASLYTSHFGIQNDILYPLWAGLQRLKRAVLERAEEGSRWHERLNRGDLYYSYKISQFFNALFAAVIISLFPLWAGRQFGVTAGWVTLALIAAGAPALDYFARNIWWMIGFWYVPMMAVLLWLASRKQVGAPGLLAPVPAGLVAGAGVYIKAGMGYAFLAPIMCAALVPVLFYAIWQKWSVPGALRTIMIVGLLCLAGFAAAFATHWSALESIGKDPGAAIQAKFEGRAHGGESVSKGWAAESTATPALQVLAEHFFLPQKIAWPQILIMLPFFIWLWRYIRHGRASAPRDERREYSAFIAAIALSAFGAIFMLVTLKGHAYIHGFDVVVWNIPLNLFLFAFYARLLTGGHRQARTNLT